MVFNRSQVIWCVGARWTCKCLILYLHEYMYRTQISFISTVPKTNEKFGSSLFHYFSFKSNILFWDRKWSPLSTVSLLSIVQVAQWTMQSPLAAARVWKLHFKVVELVIQSLLNKVQLNKYLVLAISGWTKVWKIHEDWHKDEWLWLCGFGIV